MRKGYKHTAEAKTKMSAAKKADVANVERMRALAIARNSQPMSVDTRAKISAARKARTGWKHAPETRAKIGAAHVGMKRTADTRARLAASRRASGMTDARRLGLEKTWAAARGTKRPESGAAISAAKLAYWKTRPKDERRAHMAAAIKASRQARPSSIELTIRALLDSLGVAYETEKRIGAFHVDVFVPSRGLVIECDGEYWHRHTKGRDQRRDAFMIAQGFAVLRLPEHDIRSGAALSLVKGAVA